jgi:hypothetical protein
MYRVGFGDFFLVTVPTSSGNQYILIDCGVFKGTSGTGDIGSIVDAVEDMYKTTKGHLALVIMTHRHADHIAGFSKAPRFKDFTASMVWMPYWEQFNDPKQKKKDDKQFDSSTHNLLSDIHQLTANLALQFSGGQDSDAKEALSKVANAGGETEPDNSAHNLLIDIHSLATNLGLQFGAKRQDDPAGKEALAQLANATGIEDFSVAANGKKGGGGNAAALDLLKNHLGNHGKNVRYYAAGDEAELPEELEGLTAKILGPPPEKARAFLALMDLKKGVGQYLDSMNQEGGGPPKPLDPFPREWEAKSDEYPELDVREKRIDYQEFVQYVDNAQPDMLVAAASKIENFLNNQSLVVLFEFGGKKLLFAGDAQGGNWEYWLFKTDEPQKDPTKAGDIVEASKELLQTIDFYKVGHHGSTNATPIQAVEAAINRPEGSKGFVSMCSTQAGVFGSVDNNSEVPRLPLMTALSKGSCLVRSDALPIRMSDGTVIKATKGVDVPKPKVGKINQADLYIEYSF